MKRPVWPFVVLGLALSRPVAASTRLAVFIVADDAPLSYNLTEVAISRLAEKPGYELLGLRELERRLNELSTVKGQGLRACLAEPSCLSEVAALAGVEQTVVGDVRREDDRYRVELSLVQGKTGHAKARHSQTASLEIDELIAAVQAGVSDLVPDASPAVTSPVAPPARAPVAKAPKESGERKKEPGRSAFLYLGYGTAALSVIAFSAAAVSGTIGSARPEGEARAEVQDDLERRRGYANVANGLFVAGGLLAGAAAVSFTVSWD